ncbi:hypothetical protein VTJ83DRAFT_1954 [Remersonia thermophila]|uniref:Nucleotide exchange factor SIL1 n=1 Tax=Remersonia thermophila TaxID=72144 RepID=A0ABR4DHE2_9PEZI
MSKIRLKTLPISLVALVGLMAWGSAASSSDSSSSASPSESPSAEVELICHTNNPADCYPKVFQPTDEFQVVHPDQDLPPGLHVRLNINTGLKEAKINVPDEHRPDLEGLPVDSSVVVVEPDPPSADDDQPKIPPNAPAYDPAGKIKEPKSASSGEAGAFYKSLTILKKGLDVDGALEMLEEISHDIYYGLKIAEDYDTVHELFCLATAPSPAAATNDDGATLRRARVAALTLASTVQNHPKALREIERHWARLSSSLCPASTRSPRTTTLGTAIFSLLPPADAADQTPPDASLTKIRVSLLTGLLKSPVLRAKFLAASPAGGSAHILRILTSPPPAGLSEDDATAWAATQRRSAQLLNDVFLDADMGAALGEWPSSGKAPLSAKECAALHEAGGTAHGREECLDWHVERLQKEFKKDGDHWSHELGKKLAEARKNTKPRKNKKNKDQDKEEL